MSKCQHKSSYLCHLCRDVYLNSWGYDEGLYFVKTMTILEPDEHSFINRGYCLKVLKEKDIDINEQEQLETIDLLDDEVYADWETQTFIEAYGLSDEIISFFMDEELPT